MKKLSKIMILALMAFMPYSQIFAGILWSDNFDYAGNETLQDHGWQISYLKPDPTLPNTYDPATGNYWEARLDDTVSVSGPKSAWLVQGQSWAWVGIEAKHTFTSKTSGSISLDMRASTKEDNVAPARFFLKSSTGKNVGCINFAAQWGVYVNDRVWTAQFNPEQWYHIDMSWNAATRKISVSIDGANQVIDNFWDMSASNVGSIVLLNNSAPSSNGPSAAWFDNIVVIPEPGTIILLGIGMTAMFRTRKS